MKTVFFLALITIVSAHAADSDLYEQVSQQFPEAITETESYSASEISNSTKRQPQATRHVSIDRDLVMKKMLQRMNEQQQEIDNLKKTISTK